MRACSIAHLDGASARRTFVHHALGRRLAQLLQPALVDVLQHGVCCDVGFCSCGHAVKTDHGAVEGLANDEGIAHTGLEVFELRPHVELGVVQMGVEVRLKAVVLGAVQRGQIARGAVFELRVRAAGCRAADAQAQLCALLLAHGHDVDALEHVCGLLNFGFQGLRHGGGDGELLARAGNGVQGGELGCIGRYGLAGDGVHVGIPGEGLGIDWGGLGAIGDQQSVLGAPSPPLAGGRAVKPDSGVSSRRFTRASCLPDSSVKFLARAACSAFKSSWAFSCASA